MEKIESAPNWYSLPGLGLFFDAGWLYQPEMDGVMQNLATMVVPYGSIIKIPVGCG